MKPEDIKKYREFLEDPSGELPAELAAELSTEERLEAGRHQELDRKLARALGELGAAVDKRVPARSEADFKKSLLAAIDEAAGKAPVDELAYLRKMRGRDITRRLVERPAYSFGAVAALLALAFLPFVFQGQSTGPENADLAMNESDGLVSEDFGQPVAEDEGAEGMRLGAPAPGPAQPTTAKPAAPAGEGRMAVGASRENMPAAAPPPAAPAAPARPEAELVANADAEEPQIEEEVAINLEAPAISQRSMPAEALAPSAAPRAKKADNPAADGAPGGVTMDVKQRLREKVLMQKVKTARDTAAKRKALQNLEAFYRQHGQTAKRQNVQRQIQNLK